MNLLSHTELLELIATGVVQGAAPEQVNASSIDVTLGLDILVERNCGKTRTVRLSEREPLQMFRSTCAAPGYLLWPGEFVLACSREIFNLPLDISAEYKLKSSMARVGLEHLKAGWCDAGWTGSVLTLELKNMTQWHNIMICHGDLIGQVVFFRHVPVSWEHSYGNRGRYNGDRTTTGAKP